LTRFALPEKTYIAARMNHLHMEIKALDASFLEKPLGYISHQLLHATCVNRSRT